ncbi:Folylpolyglutamate synthase, mitochondrial, partial [Pseudolycoriella hygida]
MLTVITSKLIHRLCIPQHQNMVHEIIRSVSIPSKLKNIVSEKQEMNGALDTYERAIVALNSLQSNASRFAQSVALRQHNVICTQVQQTEKYLIRSGMDCKDLDRLSVIHVAGTKGKGSTSAFTDSILSSFGITTGFFSSPHLIHVNERIRINGTPVSKELFAKYFWKVYHTLDNQKEHDKDMPAYFQFLTLMSFHLFLAEKVDVVILEVGLGGEHDCTNVVRNTKTVGITSLGLEHTSILGNTLTEIAWQKAGIIKQNSDVFSVPQPDECIETIQSRCASRNATLHIIPPFKDYNWPNTAITKSTFNDVQQLNASLAIQLSWNWLKHNPQMIKNPILIDLLEENPKQLLNLTNEFITGINNFSWPGRFQTLQRNNQRFFIDGAHTMESLKLCLEWFKLKTSDSPNRKMLLFNVTGDRDAEKMLQILYDNGIFDCAIFSPNFSSLNVGIDNDSYSALQGSNSCERCAAHAGIWTKLLNQNLPHENNCDSKFDSSAHIFNCIAEVLSFLDNECKINGEEADVLVTGSLHLVGATLSAI